jgi:sporulation protein YlmC with PRC-barrel domain
MDLRVVHELLDKPVLDEARRNIGRVDGVVLELRRGAQPRITAFEIGGRVWARRLHPRIARWAVSLGKRWPALANGVTRIPMEDVRTTGITVSVKCDGRTTPAMGWEHWLRRNVISRIPGA